MRSAYILIFSIIMTSTYAGSDSDGSNSLSDVGFSSTNVVIPLQKKSSDQNQSTATHPKADAVQNNFSNLGNQNRRLDVSISRDDEADCSGPTNQCSFKPRPLNMQQSNQRGNAGSVQPNSNWGIQLQRQQ